MQLFAVDHAREGKHMTVREAAISSNYRVQSGDMASVCDVKRILGNNADQQIVDALKNREIWLHATDRAHLMTAEQQAAELVRIGEQFFNCITLR